MRLHTRTRIVSDAEVELTAFISQLGRKYHLTSIELLQILATRSQNELKYMLRSERHPNDPSKKADEE
jgi:hypothetical protein